MARIGTIVGGGAIATESVLRILADRHSRDPKSVAMIGVDLERYENSSRFSDSSARFLDNIGFLSVRCKSQAAVLLSVLGRAEIAVQPDIAFAMPNILRAAMSAPAKRESKILGINVTPLSLSRQGARFVPSYDGWGQQEYERKWPEQAAIVRQAGISCARILIKIVDCYLARGWTVWCIPFTPLDELFARTLFPSPRVRVFRYIKDAPRVFGRIKQCSRFIATRFHSHVFALAAGVPTYSVAYAPKCKDLWDDLSLRRFPQLDVNTLVRDEIHAVESVVDGDPAHLGRTERERLAAESCDYITSAFNAVIPAC